MVHIASHRDGQTQDVIGSTGEVPSLYKCCNCTQERSESQQPLSCCSGDLLTLLSGLLALIPQQGCTWSPFKANYLQQKPPQLDSRALILYWKCITLDNVTSRKYLAEIQGYFFKPSLHQSFTTEILLLKFPWHWMEAQSTPHTHSPPILLPSWVSCIPHFFFTSSCSQGITLSLCSSCKIASFLWSVPCGYPLILIPALSFNYVPSSTLLKYCQTLHSPFLKEKSRPLTQMAISARVHHKWWMDHFRVNTETCRALFSAVRVNWKGIKFSASCLLYFSPSKCHTSCSMMCSANLPQFSWWCLEKRLIP